MIKDYVEKYYMQQDHNCAESIFLAASEAWELGLTEEDAKLVSAFGGGMGCGSACGALCGSMAILGKVAVRGRAHTTEGFRENCAALKAEFEEKLGGMFCKELKERNFNEGQRCLTVVLAAADVLDARLRALRGASEAAEKPADNCQGV